MRLFKKHDVFISYAIEEKHSVAGPVAEYLKKKRINTWYAGNELKVGDSIPATIHRGLHNSKYFILVLSPNYIRHWTILELFTFLHRESLENEKLILPVWHNLDYEEAKNLHPFIAERFAVLTAEGMDVVCAELYEAIREKKKKDLSQTLSKVLRKSSVVILCLAVIFFLCKIYLFNFGQLPSKQYVRDAIEKHTARFQSKLENEIQKEIVTAKAKLVPVDCVIYAYNIFVNTSEFERNEYRFAGEFFTASGFKNIEALGIPPGDAPYTGYGMAANNSYSTGYTWTIKPDTTFYYSFFLVNATPLSFVVDTLYESEEKVHVHVSYKQNIRAVEGTLTYPYKNTQARKQFIQLTGYKPAEEYIFEIKKGMWSISGVK